MKKVLGIFILVLVVIILTAAIAPPFRSPVNIQNIIRWTGLYGIMTIGEAFVIITGGIDLSVGSIVGLTGTITPMMLDSGMSIWLVTFIIFALSLVIGLTHGLLITKLRLQPFVVTLCGLFVYRGMARYIAGDATQGFGTGYTGLKYLAKGMPLSVPIPGVGWVGFPMPIVILAGVALLAILLLNYTIYGRYLYALGRNEIATRFSGINTDRMIILAYIISAVLAGFTGVLFALDLSSVQPSGHGNFFELYAIAGCVLGGCSLRGGEGSIIGVIVGTLLVRVLYNAINILGIATQLEYVVIGVVILLGVAADEIFKTIAAKRRASRQAAFHDLKSEHVGAQLKTE
ncbi:MAG: ABC transporter permease [bacterium]|jgi:ribose transport system permease protein